ncbi:MAG: endonuclease/exonuclease/phosphatase family protein [Bacteroidales bacterium]|nr:endonuclease/exonuclease/phosphatase family protein [Bacteroidales bacterium]
MVLGAVIGCSKAPKIYPVYGPGGIEDTPKEEEDDPTLPDEMVVCSFNIRISTTEDDPNNAWKYRKQGVFDFIKTVKPDMIGMQELKFVQEEDLFKEFGYAYEIYHINRDTGSALTSSSGEAVGILLKKDRFKIVDKGFYWLCDTPDKLPKDTGWGGACRRVTLWVKAQDLKNDNRIVYFSSTHFDHQSSTAVENSSPLCINRLRTLCGRTDLKSSGDPVFFMGDLNTLQSDVALKPLMDNLTYARLSLTGDKTDGDRTVNGYNTTTNKIIDHIFFGGDVTPVRYWVDRKNYCTHEGTNYISDHYPVLFKVQYKTIN